MTAATADSLFSVGVERVVIGTAAVENPQLVASLCQDYGGERVVVAVDARDGRVTIKGLDGSQQGVGSWTWQGR